MNTSAGLTTPTTSHMECAYVNCPLDCNLREQGRLQV